MKRRLSPFIALRYVNFRWLWIGLFISSIGTQMQIVGVIWHIYELTHSPFSLGIIGIVRFLPLLIFSPIGGMIADTFNRKKIIFINQILMGTAAFFLAFFTFLKIANPLFIYLVLILNSIGHAIDSPTRQALTPHLLPRKFYINAVSLNALMYQASIAIGPAIAGLIIAYFNVGYIYLFNALSFLAVNISLLFIKTSGEIKNSNNFSLSALKEGIRFIIKSPLISSTMLLDFFATFFSSANTLLPIFAKDILKVGPKGLGLLFAASSAGAVAAGLIFSSFRKIKRQGAILLAAVIIYGSSTALFGISKLFYLSIFFLSLAGAGDMVATIIRNTIRQLNTPDHLRGRMTAINMIFYSGGPQLGEIEAGVVAGFFGAPFSVVTGGIITIIVAVITALKVEKLRRY